MASPEVAVLRVPALGSTFDQSRTFEKFNGTRSKLRTAQISATVVAAAFPEIHARLASAPTPPATATVGKPPLSLPVIDLGGLRCGDPAVRAKIVRQIGSATEEWGFFQVVNHSVPDDVVERLHQQARQFFGLPLDVKKRLEIYDHNPRALGYKGTFCGKENDGKIPLKESLADFRSPSSPAADLAVKIWGPDGNTAFSDAVQDHCSAVEKLGLQLLELLGESLGLKRDFFAQHFHYPSASVGTWRLHHFPPNAAPLSVWRTVPHSDPSVLTILKQDVGGLQIKKPGGGIWIDVNPLPGSFVINVGDILEAWSNGRFPSVEHRVSFEDESVERFSTVNFLDAGPSMHIEAPPELIDDAHPSLFVPFLASDFRGNFEKIKRQGDIRKGKALDYVRRCLL